MNAADCAVGCVVGCCGGPLRGRRKEHAEVNGTSAAVWTALAWFAGLCFALYLLLAAALAATAPRKLWKQLNSPGAMRCRDGVRCRVQCRTRGGA